MMGEREFEIWIEKDFCPLCKTKLQKRYEGTVCKNHQCPL